MTTVIYNTLKLPLNNAPEIGPAKIKKQKQIIKVETKVIEIIL